MKDINKLLDSMDTYWVVMDENPVEYAGHGDAINFAKYLIEKFNIKSCSTVLEEIKHTWTYFDAIDRLEDEIETPFDQSLIPTEIGGEDISNYELDVLLTIDYLMSDSCSEEAYKDFIEAMEKACM